MEPRQLRMLETIEDAIKEDIAAVGGPKEAAKYFYPDKTPEQGAGVLRAWSLENRAERPSPSQLLMLIEIARNAAGFSECARFFEQRLCCRIEWLTPDDEKARLQQDFVCAVRHLAKIQNSLERNEARVTSLKKVSG